jgi:hypothetical protein
MLTGSASERVTGAFADQHGKLWYPVLKPFRVEEIMPLLRVTLMFAATASLVAVWDQRASGGQSAEVASKGATASSPALTAKGAPRRRDGYWEFASIGASGTVMDKQFLCVGSGSEDKYSIFDQLSELGSCSKKDFTRTPTGWSFETQCSMMNVTTVQKGVIAGDFQNNFRVDQTVTQSSGGGMKGAVVGRHIGDCPGQYKPGDLVDGDGSTLTNVLN